MKKLLILMLLYGLYAKADMDSDSNNNNSFVTLYGGLNPTTLMTIGFGRHITNSSNSYFGSIIFGATFLYEHILIPTAVTSLKVRYGYEFMRQNTVSFGLDTSLILTNDMFDESSIKGFRGDFGLFVKTEITESIATLLRVGSIYLLPLIDESTADIHWPYIELGVRYYL